MDEEEKAIKYICKYTGLSGIEAKHIYDALQKLGTVSVYDIDWEQAISPAREYGDRYKAVWNYLHDLYGIPKPITQEEIKQKMAEAEKAEVEYGKKYLEDVIEDVLSKFEPEEQEEIKEYLKEVIVPSASPKEKEEIMENVEERIERRLREIEEERERREREREEKVEERIRQLEKRLEELLRKKEEMEKKTESVTITEIRKQLEDENPEFEIEVKIENNMVTIKGYLRPEFNELFNPKFLARLPIIVRGNIRQIKQLKKAFTEEIAENRLVVAPTTSMGHKGYYECWVCGYSCSPERAKEVGYICPKCGAPLHLIE